MFKNLLNKVGFGELPSSFGYTIGDKVELPFHSVWQQHKGQKRSDGSAVSLFACIKKDADSAQVAAAKNAMQLAKSLKLPNVIQVLDTCETDGGIYLATEPVVSLLSTEAPEETEGEPNVWGLYQALDALNFLHTSGFVHGLFGPASVFVTPRGDYRLSGFELCKKTAEAGDMLAGCRRIGPKISGWPEPPAYLAEGTSPTAAVDFWGAVVLAAYVFGVARAGRGRGVDYRLDLAKATQDFPAELRKVLAELQKPGPLRGRSPIADLIALQYFQQHPAVHMMAFLGSLHIRSTEEKESFFEAMPTNLDRVPEHLRTRQVLPGLLDAQKFPGQEAAQVLPSILKIGKGLKEEEFKEKVAPLVVQLFTSPDRSIRFRLLMSIGDMIGNLDDAMINDKIFPECVNGFTDSSGPIREATVKAMIHFIPRLKQKTVEGRVLKLLLKVIQDPEASIRTNAVICCGRISGHLSTQVASQTLGQALSVGLKDPFSHCRSASLHTLNATCAIFPAEELANRLLPQVCMRLVDPDTGVSDVAFEVLAALQKHLRTQVEERRAAAAAEAAANGGQAAAEAPTDSSSQGTWGSWAFSTVGAAMSNKIMGSMTRPASGSSVTDGGTPDKGGATPSAATPAPPAEMPPAEKPAAPQGAGRNSGMSLSSASKAERSSTAGSDLDLGGGAVDLGAGWGDDDDQFWDDFDDKPAPAKAAPAPAPAPAPKAAVKAAPAPKAKASVPKANALAEADDFFKDFDM